MRGEEASDSYFFKKKVTVTGFLDFKTTRHSTNAEALSLGEYCHGLRVGAAIRDIINMDQ